MFNFSLFQSLDTIKNLVFISIISININVFSVYKRKVTFYFGCESNKDKLPSLSSRILISALSKAFGRFRVCTFIWFSEICMVILPA